MREWLRKIRLNAHYSQHNVAIEAGIAQQYYCFIESGERGKKLPVQTAKSIASVLNFDWRLFYEDSKKVINMQQLKIGGGKNE